MRILGRPELVSATRELPAPVLSKLIDHIGLEEPRRAPQHHSNRLGATMHSGTSGATLPQLAKWTSTKPAKLAGLSARTGQLARGYDADLVVWDPDEKFVVREQGLFFKHRVSPYLEMDLLSAVHHRFLRAASDEAAWPNAARA
jgi:imidazolonepropionase-like amidohydrolase